MNREQTKQNKTFVTNMKALISAALPQNSVNIFVLAAQLIKVFLQRIHSTKIGSAIVNIFQLVTSAQARYILLTNASSSSNLFFSESSFDKELIQMTDIVYFIFISDECWVSGWVQSCGTNWILFNGMENSEPWSRAMSSKFFVLKPISH